MEHLLAESRTDGARSGGQERTCAGELSAALALGCSREWQGNSLQGQSEVVLSPALNLVLLFRGG